MGPNSSGFKQPFKLRREELFALLSCLTVTLFSMILKLFILYLYLTTTYRFDRAK